MKIISYSLIFNFRNRSRVSNWGLKKTEYVQIGPKFSFIMESWKNIFVTKQDQIFLLSCDLDLKWVCSVSRVCILSVLRRISASLYSTLHSVGNHLTFSSFLWFTFKLMENNSTEYKFILLQLSKKSFHFQEISKMCYTEIKSGSCIFAFLVFFLQFILFNESTLLLCALQNIMKLVFLFCHNYFN